MENIEINMNNIALPGFIDSHVHPLLGMLFIDKLDLSKCEEFKEARSLIKNYIKENPEKQIVIGFGFYEEMIHDLTKINRSILDEISTEKGIILNRFDFHSVLVNTKFLEMTGLGLTNLISPRGGKVDFFEQDAYEYDRLYLKGETTGHFHDSATSLVLSKLPKPSEQEMLQYLKQAEEYLISHGITAYMDAYVNTNTIHVFQKVHKDKNNYMKIPRASISISPRELFFDLDEDVSDKLSTEGIPIIF